MHHADRLNACSNLELQSYSTPGIIVSRTAREPYRTSLQMQLFTRRATTAMACTSLQTVIKRARATGLPDILLNVEYPCDCRVVGIHQYVTLMDSAFPSHPPCLS